MNAALSRKTFAQVPARVLASELDLAAAWDRVQTRAGMAGVDGVSVRRFARHAKASLEALQHQLAAGSYRALPLRMAEIPKKSGGRRLLLVPAIVDRVAQSAVAEWLSARWNPEFDPASYAYRPGRGVADALRALAQLRAAGHRWVLDADIRSFFDSIDHGLLLARLAAWLGASSPLYQWLHQWVRAPVWDGLEITELGRGVPQGSPLSPVLANYYLDEFDRRLRAAGVPLIRYADDFLVLARTPFELADYRREVERALTALHLELNPEKTRTVTFHPGFRFLGAEIQGETILLPFEKSRTPKKALWVCPPMPRSLLAAFRAGHLKPSKAFRWRPREHPGITTPVAGTSARSAIPVIGAEKSKSATAAWSEALERIRRLS